jgi:GntR family transcriptional regulator, transcriptional repressor for pyruvate dehydrogenase complex
MAKARAPASRAPRAPRAFEQALGELFTAIFDGTYAADDTLPAERVLAERYGVSRIVIRQAMHALQDAGLVETRQGGATRVLDPERADARALELVFRFGHRLPEAARDLRRELLEYQELYALALLEGAARSGTEAERRSLLLRVEQTASTPTLAAARVLDRAFWRAITGMCKNRIFRMEMALFEQWAADDAPLVARPQELRAFYHELARLLVARQDPLALYLAHTRPASP